MQEIHWPNDVAHHKNEAGHCRLSRNLASLMVRRPMQVKSYLVDLWRYLWTTKDYAMCTLPSPKASKSILKKEQPYVNLAHEKILRPSGSLKIQTYCDASFAPGGARSRSGILV